MNHARLTSWVVGQWHRPTLVGQVLLRPLAGLYRALAGGRALAWRSGLFRGEKLPVPVIVVGNLTVGGSGKTPLVGHLAEALAAAGYRPGIVSRGYGRREMTSRRVHPQDAPEVAGDEPLMLARRTGLAVAVGASRPQAARLLLPDCDVIISDDGLQHHALQRDVEVIVVDGRTGFGNGRLLPAGPLREPVARLRTVDFIAVRDGEYADAWRYDVALADAQSLDGQRSRSLAEFSGQRVHAVAAIGRPGRFFEQLENAGLNVDRHPFPDHHALSVDDLAFADDLPVLMTEKDAVKCLAFADERMWYVPAEVVDTHGLADAIVRRLRQSGNTGTD